MDTIAAVPLDAVSLDTVFWPGWKRKIWRNRSNFNDFLLKTIKITKFWLGETADRVFGTESGRLTMLGEISTDKSIRDASKEAEEKISEHEVEQSMRKDVFDRYVALQAKLAEDGCDNAEILRSVDREVKEGWKKKTYWYIIMKFRNQKILKLYIKLKF